MHANRGYTTHTDPETDSDGDGGQSAKLGGRGHLEFSRKGIPHGILHFTRSLMLAGHIFMHDTTASEGAHRLYVKKVIRRVRKLSEHYTACSSIDWIQRVQTWAKCIDIAHASGVAPASVRTRESTTVDTLTVEVPRSKVFVPDFSPLRAGGHRLLSNDVRLSYHELGTLVSRYTGWNVDFVQDSVHVRLYCSALVRHAGGERRTYWATETRYAYNRGSRRDMIEVDLGQGRSGSAQITAFIKLHADSDRQSEGVLIRWLSKSSLSTTVDHKDRPLCDYPLCNNHCLWEWSDVGQRRDCFRVRGFRNRVNHRNLWSHVKLQNRTAVIQSEIRARYDIIGYGSIKGHVNINTDPSTGHMLQTVQIV